MADDLSILTADQARVRLIREGVNMVPELKAKLTQIASGMDAPSDRRTQVLSPFGTNPANPRLTPEEITMEDEETVLCDFPHEINMTLPGNHIVRFTPGAHPVPKSLLYRNGELAMPPVFTRNGVKIRLMQAAAESEAEAPKVKPRGKVAAEESA